MAQRPIRTSDLIRGEDFSHDVYGRPHRGRPPDGCRACRSVFEGAVCPVCDTVAWARFLPRTLVVTALVAGAIHASPWLAPPYHRAAYWAAVIVGALAALALLPCWHRALVAKGFNVLRWVGGAIFFGAAAWGVAWLLAGEFPTRPTMPVYAGAILGAALECVAQRIYYHRDGRIE